MSKRSEFPPVRFSVLIPVYNGVSHIRETIDSVLSQSFTDFEILAIDDGSTDGSLAILESYGERIRLLQQNNQGPEAARNRAAALSHGQYLVMLDHDDLLKPSALAIYDQVIQEFDCPPVIIGKTVYIQPENGWPCDSTASDGVQVLRFADYLSRDVEVGHTSSQIVISRDVFEQVGGYGNMGVVPAPDDVNLILSVGTYGPCIIVRNPTTVGYRLHATQGIRNATSIATGILRLASFERQGKYPGGRERRAARYAIIGSLAANYAFRHCWARGRRKLALRLFFGTAPMICVAVFRRMLRGLRRASGPILLQNPQVRS